MKNFQELGVSAEIIKAIHELSDASGIDLKTIIKMMEGEFNEN